MTFKKPLLSLTLASGLGTSALFFASAVAPTNDNLDDWKNYENQRLDEMQGVFNASTINAWKEHFAKINDVNQIEIQDTLLTDLYNSVSKLKNALIENVAIQTTDSYLKATDVQKQVYDREKAPAETLLNKILNDALVPSADFNTVSLQTLLNDTVNKTWQQTLINLENAVKALPQVADTSLKGKAKTVLEQWTTLTGAEKTRYVNKLAFLPRNAEQDAVNKVVDNAFKTAKAGLLELC
ncbi:hypothetical protein [Mycoplasma hafezii]|uniref:hypothetical protein n=1 Tax=Mycoplasma hafezii TaxID=525886 RepID=UPI003CF019D5